MDEQLADRHVEIQMEGGSLHIGVTDEFRAFMTGPASERSDRALYRRTFWRF
jgi:diaminopimelate epimerase